MTNDLPAREFATALAALPLFWPEIAQLSLVPDAQHSDWTWRDLAEAAVDEAVHPYVRPYAAWVWERRSSAAGLRSA